MATSSLASSLLRCAFVFVAIIAGHCWALSNDEVAKSMFPLVPGSYWVTQDTFFTGEAEQIAVEDLGFDPKQTSIDSVKQSVGFQGGTRVTMYQEIGRKKSTGFVYELFVDTFGVVYEVRNSAGSLKIGLPLWRMFPTEGDTVFQYGVKSEVLVYDTVSKDGTVTLSPVPGANRDQPIYKFRRGVGKIGQVNPGTDMANRLIEYRIGNGPIVRKHWVMDKPAEK